MKKFLNEFKEFINRGSVMDLAVGVIIGGAFTAIVNSVTTDLIMPIVSILTGGVDFTNMKLQIPIGAGEASFAYGNFINAVLQFIIIAFVVFLMVKGLNRLRKSKKEAPRCPYCKEEIAEDSTRCSHCTAVLDEPARSTEGLA